MANINFYAIISVILLTRCNEAASRAPFVCWCLSVVVQSLLPSCRIVGVAQFHVKLQVAAHLGVDIDVKV